MVSFPQVSPPKPCTHLSLSPYVPHAPPISFFSILSPAQYWVRTDGHVKKLIVAFCSCVNVPKNCGNDPGGLKVKVIWSCRCNFLAVVLNSNMVQSVDLRPLTAGAPVSIPHLSVWGFCWTKWRWDTFFSEYFGFPLSVNFQGVSGSFTYLIPRLYNLSIWRSR